MAKYIVKRVIMALITILVVACVTFVLMMSVPGSPFNDEKITPEQKAAMVQPLLEANARNITAAYRAGLKLGFGTDTDIVGPRAGWMTP